MLQSNFDLRRRGFQQIQTCRYLHYWHHCGHHTIHHCFVEENSTKSSEVPKKSADLEPDCSNQSLANVRFLPGSTDSHDNSWRENPDVWDGQSDHCRQYLLQVPHSPRSNFHHQEEPSPALVWKIRAKQDILHDRTAEKTSQRSYQPFGKSSKQRIKHNIPQYWERKIYLRQKYWSLIEETREVSKMEYGKLIEIDSDFPTYCTCTLYTYNNYLYVVLICV